MSDQAVELDPTYGKAWARLAKSTYVSMTHRLMNDLAEHYSHRSCVCMR